MSICGFCVFSKIHRYSPTDTGKTWDKGVNRRGNVRFNPVRAIEIIKKGAPSDQLDYASKIELLENYLEVRDICDNH